MASAMAGDLKFLMFEHSFTFITVLLFAGPLPLNKLFFYLFKNLSFPLSPPLNPVEMGDGSEWWSLKWIHFGKSGKF